MAGPKSLDFVILLIYGRLDASFQIHPKKHNKPKCADQNCQNELGGLDVEPL